MTSQIEHRDRPLRADAERNRAKILAAAAQVFAERGLEATLDEVANAAGVGVGTVYRRFPDKNALVGALFENAVDEFATLACTAITRENSWDALVWFLEQALERQCSNLGLRDVVFGSPIAEEQLESAKRRISPAIELLVQRAQRDGYLRKDVVTADFTIMEMMISSLGNANCPISPELWRRYLTIMLDGLVVSRNAPSSLHGTPDEDVLSAAMLSVKGHAPRRS